MVNIYSVNKVKKKNVTLKKAADHWPSPGVFGDKV